MKKIIVIVGPTGVGKTKMSVLLAKALNGEIINADSMQVYKQLNIGTAKIKDHEKENIPHYLFDIKNVIEEYSVYNYQKDCREYIDKILNENKTPIIVGGTGLYIKAALYDYVFNEESYDKNDYGNYSNEQLYKMLIEVNPNTDIHINNRKRVVRTLNKYNNDNNQPNNSNNLIYDAIFIGLTMPREELYNRINNRVEEMFEEGLLDEVKVLYEQNIISKAINTAIGYKEVYQYLDNNISKEEMIDVIKKNSRRYAKRQYTWFNNQMNIKWFNVDINNFNNTFNEVLEHIKNNAN
jgi:tRNA dimethylallyltransferase